MECKMMFLFIWINRCGSVEASKQQGPSPWSLLGVEALQWSVHRSKSPSIWSRCCSCHHRHWSLEWCTHQSSRFNRLWYRGNLSTNDTIAHVLGQLVGALFAGLLLNGAGPTVRNTTWVNLIGIEILITFLLMASILWIIRRTEQWIPIAVVVGSLLQPLPLFLANTRERA